nr:immunoglobulin light chain junction region [Macaca mulatta]MOV92175.1 immunoglobulin light chain junction region [Macaca mulatta]MOV92180.1 immunoglobulin light chain junction region [Macaca mulatta]MOV92233.1 immunoglobulin light chain junction region [Macaca mulatta]MOV92242.1 immunoglobulin light chain junction region [Macaca mulatta]
CQQYNSVPRTF